MTKFPRKFYKLNNLLSKRDCSLSRKIINASLHLDIKVIEERL